MRRSEFTNPDKAYLDVFSGEADLISEDLLDFRRAKYIKNFGELQELPSLTCSGCGHVFHSRRKDSIKRHISRGVWYVKGDVISLEDFKVSFFLAAEDNYCEQHI